MILYTKNKGIVQPYASITRIEYWPEDNKFVARGKCGGIVTVDLKDFEKIEEKA